MPFAMRRQEVDPLLRRQIPQSDNLEFRASRGQVAFAHVSDDSIRGLPQCIHQIPSGNPPRRRNDEIRRLILRLEIEEHRIDLPGFPVAGTL